LFINEIDILLYPNPASKWVNIPDGIVEIKFFDLSGK
jgi:hypothetical protein